MIPIIFAVFANDANTSLSLIEERRVLLKIFNDPMKVELRILENADFSFINEIIVRDKLHERIVVFHYAGHADGKNIKLIDGNIVSSGLALLFSSFTNLQLIFLNGCDTYEQTKAIQKEGVKSAILTTINPINDSIAVQFADYFYFAFYHLNSLSDSFSSAQARIAGKYSTEQHQFVRQRGLGVEVASEMTQGISEQLSTYVLAANNDDYLNRTLLFNLNFKSIPTLAYQYNPNQMLITSLSHSIYSGTNISTSFKESSEYQRFLTSFETYRGVSNNRNFQSLIFDILSLLPFPLSFHISRLNEKAIVWKSSDDGAKILFLKQQIVTYNSLIQLLSFTLLSSFWQELSKKDISKGHSRLDKEVDEIANIEMKEISISMAQWNLLKSFATTNESSHDQGIVDNVRNMLGEIYQANEREHVDLIVRPGQWAILKQFLNANELNSQEINYPSLIITIREIFEINRLDPFITEYLELREIFDSEEEFFNVHLHMQGIKAAVNNGEIRKLNIDWLCNETEGMLSRIFAKAGFIVRYKLTTVKHIEISKSRLHKPRYFIQHIVLDGEVVPNDDIVEFSEYTDSYSVILARGIDPETFTKFMTLSPFIIDENSIKGEDLSKPYFFSYCDGDSYVYRWAENPDVLLKIKRTSDISLMKTDSQSKVSRRLVAIKNELDEFVNLVNLKT